MGKFSTLRNNKYLSPLFYIRDWFMKRFNLFKLKAFIKSKYYFYIAAKEDNIKRKEIEKKIYTLPTNLLEQSEYKNLTVSLTSYGTRVEMFAPYAIYTIFNQKIKPNRIILNIDKQKWNKENIPSLLKHLELCGLEINYVEDLGPHTKLLPTLIKYPDDIIITLDDDVYYEDVTILELYNEYKKSDNKSVICRAGRVYQRQNDSWLSYSSYPSIDDNNCSGILLPYGVAGVLYPPHIFSNEIFNKKVFKELSPIADDLWFSVMELRDCIPVLYVKNNSWTGNSDIDRNEEQNIVVSGALHMRNDLQNKNDIQLDALLKYYKL